MRRKGLKQRDMWIGALALALVSSSLAICRPINGMPETQFISIHVLRCLRVAMANEFVLDYVEEEKRFFTDLRET